jgi:DNA-binding protein YbaB
MDYDGPTKLTFLPAQPQEEENPFFNRNAGPPVAPGTYKVTVTVKGQSQTQTVQVEPDPRFHVDKSVFEAQTKAGLEVRDEVSALNRSLNRMESLHAQIGALEKVLQASGEGGEDAVPASYRTVLEQARVLDKKLRKLEEEVYNTEVQPAGEDSVHYLARFHDRLTGLMRGVAPAYDQPPNEIVLEEMATMRKELETHLQDFNSFLKTDVTAFNKMALEKGANTLFAGKIIELKGGTTAEAARGDLSSSPR